MRSHRGLHNRQAAELKDPHLAGLANEPKGEETRCTSFNVTSLAHVWLSTKVLKKASPTSNSSQSAWHMNLNLLHHRRGTKHLQQFQRAGPCHDAQSGVEGSDIDT